MDKPPAKGSGPTVRRMLLGSELRKYREQTGVGRADAGHHIRGSESKISRMELGRVGFKRRDVEDLLRFYGVEDRSLIRLMGKMAEETNKPGWWQQYGEALPDWFQVYVGLEEAATVIRVYEVQFIPGLLQTEEYARAVMIGGHTPPPPNAEERVQVRMRRQRHIQAGNKVKLWAVLDEAAVRRPVGDREIMRVQLERLIELSERPNITLQVIPFTAGPHAAEAGSFTILRYPEFELSDMVYLEQLSGSLLLDKRQDIDQYTMAMEQLSVVAVPPQETKSLLKEMIEEL